MVDPFGRYDEYIEDLKAENERLRQRLAWLEPTVVLYAKILGEIAACQYVDEDSFAACECPTVAKEALKTKRESK